MKRSEMVTLIAEKMERLFDWNNGSWQADAEKVLEMIETSGMLPPDRPIITELEQPYVEHLPGVPMVAQIENSNTWEPEND